MNGLSVRRGKWMFGAAVVAGVMVLTSAAWACTTHVGKLTLSQTGQTTKTNTGDGTNAGFCGTAQTMTITKATSFTATWVPGTDAGCNDSPPTGTMTMSHFKTGGAGDCHNNGTAFSEHMTVDANHSGTATLAANQWSAGDNQFCINNSGKTYGMDMAVSLM